jgi:hypothetical protein
MIFIQANPTVLGTIANLRAGDAFRLEGVAVAMGQQKHLTAGYAPPSRVHWVKSMALPHFAQVWSLLNSSEKISLLSPHSGHLQIKDFRFLKGLVAGAMLGCGHSSLLLYF